MTNKRSKSKHPNLTPNLNLKVRQELVDYDYLDKLSDAEKDWLNQFTGEYVGASFKKTKAGNYSGKNLHKGKKMRKDCYDRNNWRNNDVYSVTKANDMLKDEEARKDFLEAVSSSITTKDVEDNLINKIDGTSEKEEK